MTINSDLTPDRYGNKGIYAAAEHISPIGDQFTSEERNLLRNCTPEELEKELPNITARLSKDPHRSQLIEDVIIMSSLGAGTVRAKVNILRNDEEIQKQYENFSAQLKGKLGFENFEDALKAKFQGKWNEPLDKPNFADWCATMLDDAWNLGISSVSEHKTAAKTVGGIALLLLTCIPIALKSLVKSFSPEYTSESSQKTDKVAAAIKPPSEAKTLETLQSLFGRESENLTQEIKDTLPNGCSDGLLIKGYKIANAHAPSTELNTALPLLMPKTPEGKKALLQAILQEIKDDVKMQHLSLSALFDHDVITKENWKDFLLAILDEPQTENRVEAFKIAFNRYPGFKETPPQNVPVKECEELGYKAMDSKQDSPIPNFIKTTAINRQKHIDNVKANIKK